MTKTTEYLLLLSKFGTNALTPPVVIPYSFEILKQQFDNIFRLILNFSGPNG